MGGGAAIDDTPTYLVWWKWRRGALQCWSMLMHVPGCFVHVAQVVESEKALLYWDHDQSGSTTVHGEGHDACMV